MTLFSIRGVASAAALTLSLLASAQASIIISEVSAFGSGNNTYAADWFELTNTGSTAVNITGWKMDDNSNAFSQAVALRGVTSIAAGQSVVFLEGTANGSTDATINAAFKSAWFGANAPASLVLGNYGGSGVGLSTTADAVNIFDASGALITRVDFGVSSAANRTFDNAAGLNNVTISQVSTAGVNGAFVSANGAEIGSPGSIGAVPEPESYAIALVGLAVLGLTGRRARRG
ncbi:MAG: lamin tail domain-containing protein [Aquabacterium sp.]